MRNLIFLLLCVFSISAIAQDTAETNTDILLEEAQNAYRDGNFEESLRLTQRGLELAPEYHDIRIIQVRNQWAMGQMKAADRNLEFLLENASGYFGVKALAIQHISHLDTEMAALESIEKAEKFYPNDSDLQIRKAQLLYKMNRRKEARSIALKEISRQNISGAQRYSLQTILNRTVTDEVGLSFQYMSFSEEYSRNNSWTTSSFEYQHNFNKTAVIGRVIYADRSYTDGLMYELEAYPVFNERWYSFVNLGLSNGSLFPDFRGSASVYYNFAEVFEAEAGGRLLHFPQTDFFNGILGLSLYEGKFLFNARTFIGPARRGQLVQNYQGNIRYYLGNPDNYLFLRLGTGISPDERTRLSAIETNPGLQAFYFNAGIRHIFLQRNILQVQAGFMEEEINQSVSGKQFTASVAYRFRF